MRTFWELATIVCSFCACVGLLWLVAFRDNCDGDALRDEYAVGDYQITARGLGNVKRLAKV